MLHRAARMIVGYPETVFEGIGAQTAFPPTGLDFWPGTASALPVVREKLVGA